MVVERSRSTRIRSISAALTGLLTVVAGSLSPSPAMAGGNERSCATAAPRSGVSPTKEACVDRPTRRLDIVVNLDPDAYSSWSEWWRGARLSQPLIEPAETTHATIRDSRGDPVVSRSTGPDASAPNGSPR